MISNIPMVGPKILFFLQVLFVLFLGSEELFSLILVR